MSIEGHAAQGRCHLCGGYHGGTDEEAHGVHQTFSLEEVIKILTNLGVDTSCGACMEVAFTGVTTNSHTCSNKERGRVEVIIEGYGGYGKKS